MTRHRCRGAALTGLLALTLAGCQATEKTAGSEPYQEEFGDPPLGGKTDAISDVAEKIALGETRTGKVEAPGQQGDSRLYTIDLRMGDRVVIEMTTKRNSLKPDFIMYLNGHTRVHSESFELEGAELSYGVKVLRKEYVATDVGRYVLVVRAYHGQGSGSYELSASCKGGPCNGEFPDPQALDGGQASECIWQARTCAFRLLATEPAPISAQRAQEMFDGCLGQASLPEGYGCQSACAHTGVGYNADAAAELCTSVVGSLSFYAGKTSNCLYELDSCLELCFELQYGDSDELAHSAPYVCLLGGFNNTCDAYARDHEICGGTEYGDDWQGCCALASATDGAWTDDMDTICEDTCNDEYCQAAMDACEAQCPGDGHCWDICLDHNAWACHGWEG
jgi:hypothetical protein